MDVPKICATCGRYPFNKNCNSEMKKCNEWIRRDIEMHLKYRNEDKFNFEKVGK